MEQEPDSKQDSKGRVKAIKDYDVGVERFHKSLGAIQHAADQAKLLSPSGPAPDSGPRHATVKVLRDLPASA
jgi:hypothetical protein